MSEALPPRLRPLTPEEAPEGARPLFERFLAERGNVPNLFRTLARRPETMAAYAEVLHKVTYTGTLDLRLKETVMLRVSQLNGAVY